MNIGINYLSNIIKLINEKVGHSYINNVTVINSHDFLLSFSSLKKEKLFVSLDNKQPLIAFFDIDFSISTLVGSTNDSLRKELKDSFFKEAKLLNEDRIISLEIEKTNDLYEQESKRIILEFVPNKANFIITKENNKIVFALRSTSLDNERPILKWSYYQLPDRKLITSDLCEESFEHFQKEAHKKLNAALDLRSKEKHNSLFKYLKSRNKSLLRKIEKLKEGIERSKEELKLKDLGAELLTYNYDKESLELFLEMNEIDYDKNLSINQNADRLFKKYKKAKRTISINQEEIIKSQDEIEKLELISFQIPFMNEDELIELELELIPKRIHKNVKNNKSSSKVSYIEVDGYKIFFGKNSKQNEKITFGIAHKESTYLHIKDYKGAHVVILEENPSNEVLLTAAEICLILSNKTVGEVMYTKIKNIKKAHISGLALLNNYELIVLKSVREETKDKLRNFKLL